MNDLPQQVIELLLSGVLPPTSQILRILELVIPVFAAEPNLLALHSPLTVVGDLHGYFYDLLEIFELYGVPPRAQYLFLGDYVDRGQHSLELMTLLFCFKLLYPSQIHLLRGNHEDAKICSNYGFSQELFQKVRDFPREVWRSMTEAFEFLPLAAVIDNTAFCVHAGLSPALYAISYITAIPRFCEFPENQACLFSDLLWSDPVTAYDVIFEKSSRGAGCSFGFLPVAKFCWENSIAHIFRSHYMQNDGYLILFYDKLSTVWSAPRYTNKQNLASVVTLQSDGSREYKVFECADNFDMRSEGLDGFQAVRAGFW